MLSHCIALNLLAAVAPTGVGLPAAPALVVSGTSVLTSVSTRPTPPPPRA